jgi:16S rRNA C1402 (ribose-2'-O) methylase RsmI
VSRTFHETPKGEITVVLGPRERTVDESPALAAVADLVDAGISRKRAAEIVSQLTGVGRNRLYRGTL